MRVVVLSALVLSLAACGGSNRGSSNARVAFATGEINSACLSGGRSAANTQLCGCIQAVANQTLTARERTRAASFFANPDLAQETRASTGNADNEFWRRYRAFVDTSSEICR